VPSHTEYKMLGHRVYTCAIVERTRYSWRFIRTATSCYHENYADANLCKVGCELLQY